jgi:tetratricopeptide (TPR) repeat protein
VSGLSCMLPVLVAAGLCLPVLAAEPQAKTRSEAAAQRDSRFDELMRQGNAARAAGLPEAAVRAFREATTLKPRSFDAWWALGTSAYAMDDHASAREAFASAAAIRPQDGPPWVFLGLCDFQVGQHGDAMKHIQTGLGLGLAQAPNLVKPAQYHLAVLFNRRGDFEMALQALKDVGIEEPSAAYVDALGLCVLRMQALPSQIRPEEKDMVMRAGIAAVAQIGLRKPEAMRRYEDLVRRYPGDPRARYAFALFLSDEQPSRAIEELKQVLELAPRHRLARLQLAFEYLRASDAENGCPPAREAVKDAPDDFRAHYLMGRCLFESGDTEGAVAALETAVRLAPDNLDSHFALSKAYARLGRAEDARRELEVFGELERRRRDRRGGAAPDSGLARP